MHIYVGLAIKCKFFLTLFEVIWYVFHPFYCLYFVT